MSETSDRDIKPAKLWLHAIDALGDHLWDCAGCAYDAGAAAEREAVVRWLRDGGGGYFKQRNPVTGTLDVPQAGLNALTYGLEAGHHKEPIPTPPPQEDGDV